MKTFIISYVVPYILCLALAIISWSSSSFAALTPAQVLGTNPAQPDDLREWYCFNAGQVTFTEKCQTTTQGAVSEQGTRCAITFKAVDGTTIYTYGLSHTIDATETKNIKEAWLKDFAHKTPLCLVGIFLEKTTVQNKDQKA
ncbi:MAG: hypothetical protein J6Y94_04735, partial [Bacteriovoracaceae bacterium]|nr:hypothetical protein [Bacteriovoracaceae bacterium]